MERLQRVLSSRGIASRRRAEEMIVQGRVRVDGQIVTQLGTQVDPERQKIEVDGKLIPRARLRYIVLHKPSGYITTMADERGRYTVMDLVPVDERVVPVGRLDRQTEGLLLLTNDGEMAHRVMHPRFEIDKEYEVLLDGHPPADALERIRRGITIDGERTKPSVVRPIRNVEEGTIVRVVLHEGRNRIVRRMFEEIGYPVLRLVRTRVGPLQLGTIPRGTWRDLTDGELAQLREAVKMTDEDIESERRQRLSGPPRAGRPGPGAGGRPAGPVQRRGPSQGVGRQGGAPGGSQRSGPPQRRPVRGPRPTDGDAPRQQRDEPDTPPRRPARRPDDRPAPAGGPRPARRPGPRSEQDNDQRGPRRGGGPRKPGGGSGKPPVHNRNRRPGGGR